MLDVFLEVVKNYGSEEIMIVMNMFREEQQ